VDWARAEGTGAPRLCALLGDVGMGKTTTAKLFTQRLLGLRAGDTPCPLPILFDLRDVRITGLVATMTLDHILDGMLDAGRPAGVPRDRLSAEVVRRRLDLVPRLPAPPHTGRRSCGVPRRRRRLPGC